jgi:hypothetical protein
MYYARAGLAEMIGHQQGALSTAFILRGVLSPWGHPLYTSMTGIGFGIARETDRAWLRWTAPLLGYFSAVFLHAVWNGAATISGMLVMLMLPLWFIFIFSFFGIIVWLVIRKGRIIRDNLHDEVLVGSLSPAELDLICSPIGRLRATFRHGGAVGRRFVACGTRLGLCKWHAARAMKGQKKTISTDFIAPLRQELWRLRHELYRQNAAVVVSHQAQQAQAFDPRRYDQHPPGYAGDVRANPPDPRRPPPPPGGHRR